MKEKQLKLIIQPKVIDHLGIKMYQKPVDVIAEFIANSWDADSEVVKIEINDDSIIVRDYGIGMTYQQCQDFFLTVGRNRRKETGKAVTEEKKRPILGRKGIGKFSGFGIAKIIEVKTISKKNGELTSFRMDIEKILEYDALEKEEKPINVTEYNEPSVERKTNHGTIVSLIGIDGRSIDIEKLKVNLSRRFLLSQSYDDFKITVNKNDLPESFSDEMEFVFPRDLSVEEKEKIPYLEGIDSAGWAIEKFDDYKILWRIGFYEETIETEELRGISIFAKDKIAQKPFFFDLTGGISGQYGIEYMTGQIKMDFIDEGENDLIATERQRINLQTELGKSIKEWGTERIKLLCSIRKKKRSNKRLQELEDRLGGFKERLDALPSTERKTVKSVLLKIASFHRLGKNRYHEWCNDILTSWETGRLKELINEISETEDFDESKLIEILSEADVLTALNIAEAIKTKIVTIGELKQLVIKKELENKIRDFIYERPWIIHPKWEQFKKERSVAKIIKDAGVKELSGDIFNGRIDLILSSGTSLLLLEFMKPGLELDKQHLDRINYYLIEINNALKKQTGGTFKKIENSYVVADTYKNDTIVNERISQLERDNIFFLTWDTLIGQAIKQWEEFLDLLKSRNPSDKRIQDL